MSGDVNAAADRTQRRRTLCVYCGRRIPGSLTRAEHDHKPSPEQRFAARLTCPEHRDLVGLDPAYDYYLERASTSSLEAL